jgi:hypothetical protein
MRSRIKKNLSLIAILLMVNIVGFFTAQAYFTQAQGRSPFGVHILWESISFNPKMIAPAKWLELGIDLLKKNH